LRLGGEVPPFEQVVAVRVVKDKSTKSRREPDAGCRSKPEPGLVNFKSDGAAAFLGRAAKRSFDIFVAIIGLALFSPIFLLSSLAILVESRGPVVRPQVRHGYGNETFRVLKFRCIATENDGVVAQGVRKPACMTRVGRVLRSAGIDGLPQLINVLRGEMSIVGPGLYTTLPGKIFERQISQILRQRKVKPGLIGWAQINGYWDETDTFQAMRQRIEHDLYYIENGSFFLDMKIVVIALFSKSAYLQTE
jgi:lipopolysaccharide/colanic/teichoic acid biosynthesis glycosyltransferase